jgi:hypothetical protein
VGEPSPRTIEHRGNHTTEPATDEPTSKADLGPMTEFLLGSVAAHLDSLPYGLFDLHPGLRAQAERLLEALASHGVGDEESRS